MRTMKSDLQPSGIRFKPSNGRLPRVFSFLQAKVVRLGHLINLAVAMRRRTMSFDLGISVNDAGLGLRSPPVGASLSLPFTCDHLPQNRCTSERLCGLLGGLCTVLAPH
jgi:hypothetical protein